MQKLSGMVSHMPDWLRTIIEVGRVGGHMGEVTHPPPDEIMWFVIDTDNQLVGFDTDVEVPP